MIVTLLKPLERVRGVVPVGAELDLPWALANSLIKKRMAKVKKASKKDQRKVLGAEATAAAADKAEKAKAKAEKKAEKKAQAEKKADKAPNA
jgi:hypothetical protein